MAKEFNDYGRGNEYNSTPEETPKFVEEAEYSENNEQARETVNVSDEYNAEESTSQRAKGKKDRNSSQSASDSIAHASKMVTAVASTAAAAVAVVGFIAVAIYPSWTAGTTSLTATFTSLTSTGNEICYALDLGSSDESFSVTDDVLDNTTLHVANNFTDRSYILSDVGTVGKVDGLKEGVTYTVSVDYEGVTVAEAKIKTGTVETPAIKAYAQCRCGSDGYLYFWFLFSDGGTVFSDFDAYLVDSYGRESYWEDDGTLYAVSGGVACTEIAEGDEAYEEDYESGYRYVSSEQKIRVLGVLGGNSATLHISYSVYGDPVDGIDLDVEI